MTDRTAKELREELNRLMKEQLEHIRNQTFTWLSQEEYRKEEARLERIREVSADYLNAVKTGLPDHE